MRKSEPYITPCVKLFCRGDQAWRGALGSLNNIYHNNILTSSLPHFGFPVPIFACCLDGVKTSELPSTIGVRSGPNCTSSWAAVLVCGGKTSEQCLSITPFHEELNMVYLSTFSFPWSTYFVNYFPDLFSYLQQPLPCHQELTLHLGY